VPPAGSLLAGTGEENGDRGSAFAGRDGVYVSPTGRGSWH
jgi:hypothetical protein